MTGSGAVGEASSARRRSPSPLTEIGRIPRRDRFTSASRSVRFRLEIGRVPRRDRSEAPVCYRPGTRRVLLRPEKWSSRAASRCARGVEGAGRRPPGVSRCSVRVPAWRAERGRTFAAPTYSSPVLLRVELSRTGEEHVHVADRSRRRTRRRPPHPALLRRRVRPRKSASMNRSRRGTGPISSRNRTDLEPEPDRSRAGSEPISARNSTDLGEGEGLRRLPRAHCPAASSMARSARVYSSKAARPLEVSAR